MDSGHFDVLDPLNFYNLSYFSLRLNIITFEPADPEIQRFKELVLLSEKL